MGEVEVNKLAEGEQHKARIVFTNAAGEEVALTIYLEFEGDWLSLFPDSDGGEDVLKDSIALGIFQDVTRELM